jgi:hypothetical protein
LADHTENHPRPVAGYSGIQVLPSYPPQGICPAGSFGRYEDGGLSRCVQSTRLEGRIYVGRETIFTGCSGNTLPTNPMTMESCSGTGVMKFLACRGTEYEDVMDGAGGTIENRMKKTKEGFFMPSRVHGWAGTGGAASLIPGCRTTWGMPEVRSARGAFWPPSATPPRITRVQEYAYALYYESIKKGVQEASRITSHGKCRRTTPGWTSS